ncbi:glutamine synthetase family protein [Chroococcidiopsis sp. TS-821]|uniref:glutamine synthetase family protein n=1 Tax=Chroococcidiopsis sp. TS-821 TaxID=1378066 RepID=UPI000CEEF3AE|nr:glutamine synthetase family protein [Chroococcidiopsis sp. TS-821]PPS41420.1 glutamine synthetase [Chroococcidiopsis sp. TS-821]
MPINSLSHDFIASLAADGIRFVRILWCDNANIIRSKALHVDILSHYIEHGIGISAGQQGVPAMYDAVISASGLGPVGEIRLVPDWSNLTHLPYARGHAQAIGDMIDRGQPWTLCPRNFLKQRIASAAREGIEIQAAFENEFYLLQHADIVPVDKTLFAALLAMDINREVIDDIAEALIAQGIPVEQYYPESGPGQHEISMRYSPALVAADRQITFRATVHAIARQHNLRASFLPKIFPDAAGSGCHLHLSLWRDGKNLLPDPHDADGLSPVARAFIAGILYHLPALMAIATPSPNSYRRLRPHSWSGAFRCWGIDNREAAIRVPSDPLHKYPTHFELKTVDAAANPYLALGAVIAAGIDGVRRNLTLQEAINVDPGNLSPTERQKRGIDRLPENLGEAIAHLKQNTTLITSLNPKLAQAFLAVRQAECEAMQDFDLATEVKLLLERY